MKTAEGFIDYAAPQVAGTAEPFRSELRQHLKGHSDALENLAIEMLARGLSVRDIEDAFKDESVNGGGKRGHGAEQKWATLAR